METPKTEVSKQEIVDRLIINITRNLDELTIDDCVSQVGSTTVEVLEASFCSIFVWDDDEEDIYPLATIGSDRELIQNIDSDWATELVKRLKNLEEPYLDGYSPSLHLDEIDGLPSRAVLSCPVVMFGDWMGLMVVCRSTDRPFTEEDLNLLQPLANLSAITLPNIYNDSLVELAEICIRFLEEKDPYTHGHSIRVMRYADSIAREYKMPVYARRELKICSLLHDIGKVIIKESILTKPGKLTDYEYKIMQMHPQIGANITEKIGKNFADKIRYHHERFDGRGYPEGLKGNDIPLISRIIAIADAFDAMTSRRSYRANMEPEVAMEEILKNSGTQFDPDLVDCLQRAYNEGRFEVIHV